jgi:hypothetical protein
MKVGELEISSCLLLNAMEAVLVVLVQAQVIA